MITTIPKDEILLQVQKYCGDAVGLNASEVLVDYDLREDLGMSPMDIGQVLAQLQGKYEFVIAKEDFKEVVDTLTTVESLASYVEDELEL